jgi:hypothetical protein
MSHSTAFLARHACTLRSVAAGLTVVAAGLTLTACGDSDGTGAKASGKADNSAVAPADQGGADAGARGDSGTGGTEAGGTGGADGAAEQAGNASKQSGSAARKNSGGGTGTDAAQEIGVCDVNKAAVTVGSVKRPINHLLLKFTNRAGVDCDVPGFPNLRFDDAQTATPAAGETKPQAVVTLAPGESAYAGITTSSGDDSGAGGAKASKLTVSLEGLDGSTTVNLPGGSVYVDSTSQVTYWQSDASDALTW